MSVISLYMSVSLAVHGEVVRGGGGFYLSSLHAAQEGKPCHCRAGAATCRPWGQLHDDGLQLQVRLTCIHVDEQSVIEQLFGVTCACVCM